MLTALLRRADTWLWRPDETETTEVLLDRKDLPFALLELPLGDQHVRMQMLECNSWSQEEYVHRIKGDLLIDPDTGFVITRGLRYLRASLPYAYQAGLPSTWRTWATRIGVHPVIDAPRVISFRDVHEHNYFHFFNDVLCKVPLLEQLDLLDAPIVIGHALWRKHFFQQIRPQLEKAGLQLIDQDHRTIRTQEVVFLKCMPLQKPYLDRVLELLGPQPPASAKGRSVFLTRTAASTAQRLPENPVDINGAMEALGFEVHDTGQMTLNDQMQLLASAERLVFLHGAGATNMLFRHVSPMRVLELFPAENIAPHYYWLAQTFGHSYAGLQCGPPGPDGRFHIPEADLRAAILKYVW